MSPQDKCSLPLEQKAEIQDRLQCPECDSEDIRVTFYAQFGHCNDCRYTADLELFKVE